MKVEKVNIKRIRKDKQLLNNKKVADCLSNKDISLNLFFEIINKTELDRVLFELDYSFEQLHSKCLEDPAFCIVVSGRISKLASRQGVSDELFILAKINNFTRTLGVFVNKPKQSLVIYKDKIILKQEVKTSPFRSIDAVISGRLKGYVFCKIILGKGSTQTNS